jgi:cytochrome c peroxidase
VKALFWDGRVEVLDPVRKLYRSPLGTALPSGLQNALAVQALFPLVTPDEMLGEKSDRSPPYLPLGHCNLPNDLVSSESFKNETARILDAHKRLILRLLGTDRPNEWQLTYRVLFADAYPSKRREDLSIVDLANAIAHFEEMAFATKSSAWDRYLAGQRLAITREAKQGAILFYGKARCVTCHTGPLFSDFEYHSVGIFGSRSGTPPAIDYGRWNVTHREKDRYCFRTPPLRNVTRTAPYFHDGSSWDLKQALTRHLEPLKDSDKYRDDGSFTMSLDQIESISPVLLPEIILSEEEIDLLICFLSSLDFEPNNVDMIVPMKVPSGLPIEYPTH